MEEEANGDAHFSTHLTLNPISCLSTHFLILFPMSEVEWLSFDYVTFIIWFKCVLDTFEHADHFFRFSRSGEHDNKSVVEKYIEENFMETREDMIFQRHRRLFYKT